MENIFSQKPADRLAAAQALLELLAMAASPRENEEIGLYRERAAGFCCCLRIIRELITLPENENA